MLEKLAKQTAVYGISTIVVRFLSYLLTPYYTRVFGQETYGVVTDIYALIPLALTLLTMGMESSYFRFSAKAEEAGGDVKAAKRRLFATTWGVTSLAAAVFFLATAFFRDGIARMMGEAYVAHPEYVVWVGLIILFDVWACIPFSRLREQGRAMTFVGLKAMNVVLNVALAFGFGAAGLFATDFGVGWVFVANLIASVVTWLAILGTADRTVPKINWALLAAIFAYSLPLLVGGLAGTANEFIDRQLIKYLVPEGAMAQLGIYGAITKIAVVMMLFYQMYRLAAEPFFLSNFRKSDFVAMNAAALKYYVMASMLIFLGIALFRDVFALIVGRSFREGIFILPVVLGANVLTGVWLNLSFWYKREERTSLAIVVTGAGLVAIVAFGFWLIPLWGYYGAAWARLASETVMVAVSWWLNRRYYPTPYDWRRIGEYVAAALAVFAVCEALTASADNMFVSYAFNISALCVVCRLPRPLRADRPGGDAARIPAQVKSESEYAETTFPQNRSRGFGPPAPRRLRPVPSGRPGRGVAAYHGGRHSHRTRRADAPSPGQFPETDPRRVFRFGAVPPCDRRFYDPGGRSRLAPRPGGHDAGQVRCGLPDSRRDRLSGAGAYARRAGRGPDFRRGEPRTEILRQPVLHRLGQALRRSDARPDSAERDRCDERGDRDPRFPADDL